MLQMHPTAVAVLATFGTVVAQGSQDCPSVEQIDAGCANAVGEKPAISFEAPGFGGGALSLVVTHTSSLGAGSLMFGDLLPLPYPTLFGCVFPINSTGALGPLLPDAAGQSVIQLPLDTAITGAALPMQVAELDAAAPNGMFSASDGYDVEYAAGCVTDEQLLDTILANVAESPLAYNEFFQRADGGLTALGNRLELLENAPPVLLDSAMIPHHPDSSHVVRGDRDARLVLAYLAESIYQKTSTPWGQVRLLDPFTLGPPTNYSRVADGVAKWIAQVDAEVVDFYGDMSPVGAAGYMWAGPAFHTRVQDPAPPTQAAGQSVQGPTQDPDPPWTDGGASTETPHVPNPPATFVPPNPDGTGKGRYVPTPAPRPDPAPGDPPPPPPATVYNCLGHALGDENHSIEPVRDANGVPTTTVGTIVECEGFDEVEAPDGTPVGGGDPPAEPPGCCIKLIYHAIHTDPDEPPLLPLDDPNAHEGWTWEHAMKSTDGGDSWSSKNGTGRKYTDITDCAAFLDKFYPVPDPTEVRNPSNPGQTATIHRVRHIRYRCK